MFRTTPHLTPLAVLLAVACGGEAGPDVSTYVRELPTWPEFAPPMLPVEDEGQQIPAGDPSTFETVEGDTVLVCTTQPVSFHKTPRDYAMFSPPRDLLYPGALIQGRSLRDGAEPDDLLPLNISERAPVDITIPACLTDDATRRVQPTLAAVNQAVSSIVANAVAEGLDCVEAVGSLRQESYRNEQHKALAIGVSGRYFGFSGSADTSVERSTTENALSVTFTEQLYRVQYQAPQTPDEVFSEDFTSERLQQQIDLGRMGPDNLPVYVAEVVYGRLMNFTMVSSASESEMRAAVSAKYSNPLGNSVEGSVTAEQENLLQQSRYSVAYLGGSAEANAAMLSSLRWNDYFGVEVSVEDAVPIAFTLRNLSDNSVAAVQELTSYDLTTCHEKLADGATFELADRQDLDPDFRTPGAQLTGVGRIDADDYPDLIFAKRPVDGRGELRVAFGRGDGTFADPVATTHPAAAGATGDLSLHIGDVDRDRQDDIILVAKDPTDGVRAYVTFHQEGRGFIHSAEQGLYGGGAWPNYVVRIGQMDGKDGVDIVINNVPISTARNTTYVAHARPSSELDIESDELFIRRSGINHPANNFSGYNYTHLADFDGDGKDDFAWQSMTISGNGVYVARGTETGLQFADFRNYGSRWGGYTAHAGDVTGDGKADLVMPRSLLAFSDFGVYFAPGIATTPFIGDRRYTHRDENNDAALVDVLGRTGTEVDAWNKAERGIGPDVRLADVDGDGQADLVLNDLGIDEPLTNRIAVGLGRDDGTFSFARVTQQHPARHDWTGYETHFADLNADGRSDVLWILTGPTNSVYVGTARGN
jgi:hypothetical protein